MTVTSEHAGSGAAQPAAPTTEDPTGERSLDESGSGHAWGEVAISGGRRRTWQVVALVAVVVSVVTQVVVAWSATHPTFPFDEISTLQMSRLMAGEDVPLVRGAGYYPGWAVLLAPIWWFTSDPLTFYRTGVVIGIGVSVLTLWPLTRLGRRLGLTTAQALAGASLVMAMPVRSIQSDYLLSERLLLLFAVLSALAAYRLAERPLLRRAWELPLWLSLGLFTHARFTPVIAAAGVWLLLLAIRHWKVALPTLVLTAVGYKVADFGGKRLNEILLGHPFSQDTDLTGILANLRIGLFARAFTGQTWYQGVATFGLVGLGVVALLVLVWAELRRARFSGATFMFGIALAAFAGSVLRWSDQYWLLTGPWVRLDTWIYGRYNDAVFVLIAMVAVAAVIRVVPRWYHWLGLAGFAVIAAATVFWLGPRAPTWGYVTPAHIPGVLPFWHLLPTTPWGREDIVGSSLTGRNDFWLVTSLIIIVGLLVVIALRRRPVVVFSLLLVAAFAGSLVANQRSDRFQDSEGLVPPQMEQIKALRVDGRPATIEYDRGCSRPGFGGASQNYLVFYLLPRDVEAKDLTRARPDADVVLSCEDWTQARALGAMRFKGTFYASNAYVLPGEAQDQARARGWLEPLSATE